MEGKNIFVYDWSVEENDDIEGNIIRLWGLNENNKSICLVVKDFKPYVYMELPNDITWTPQKVIHLKNKINELLYNNKLHI